MRTIKITSFFLLFCSTASGQIQETLDGNNVNALLGNKGYYFNDELNNAAGYEIPSGSGNNPVYSIALWTSGIESDSTIHSACSSYSLQDFFPGPISDDYANATYTSTYANSIWKITRDQINTHVSSFTASGYIPDPAISEWPGNGISAAGVASQLAPYVDVNNDQIYNPMDGDYPYIQGDMAVYSILNDEAGIHLYSGGTAFGIEVHMLFYQFNSIDDDVNNTTFMNAKIFNRRDTNYVDFRVGIFMDTDIGNSTDDYIGSDSLRNLAYGYNGDSNDEGGSGQPGYGTNPPAFGIKLLNDNAGAVTSFNSSGGVMGEPQQPVDFFYQMRGRWGNTALMTNMGVPYNFIYSGNPNQSTGWTEPTDGNPPQDRRIVMSSDSYALNSNDVICLDYAFVFNQESGNAWENVDSLLTSADYIQNFYTNEIQPCNQIFLNINSNTSLAETKVFPNPSNGNVFIQISKPVVLSLYDMTGKKIESDYFLQESSEFSFNLNNGIYFLKISSGDESQIEKIIIRN